MRVLLAQINPTVGDLEGNCQKILQGIAEAERRQADLLVFPELALPGYPPDDLLLLPHFNEAVDRYLEKIVHAVRDVVVILGTPKRNPRRHEKLLCNSAAIIHEKTIIGFQDKALLPTYDVFDERRYFEPAPKTFAWEIKGKKVGITICEDIWQFSRKVADTDYAQDPIKDLEPHSPDLLINLSASPFRQLRAAERLAVCKEAAQFLKCPVLLCNQVGGNDSLIFDGFSMYVGAKGELLAHAKGFEEDYLLVDLSRTTPPVKWNILPTESLYQALILGLRDYFHKLGLKKACLGISGGIDSALVACLAVEALGKDNVVGLLMPSRFTAPQSLVDAQCLADRLGIKTHTISIEQPFQCFLDLLEPQFENRPQDTTEENLQARIRGMILMAFSNKFGYVVLSTGNKSEMAMGYATLYGDMCGGLGVISDVSKMQVYELARWINRHEELIPSYILKRPPSAELREGQLDSDSLPEYAIVDNVLGAYVENHLSPAEIAAKFHYPLELVNRLIKRIHDNEYKRRQSAPGLRVTSRAFSVGRRFPIVQKWV